MIEYSILKIAIDGDAKRELSAENVQEDPVLDEDGLFGFHLQEIVQDQNSRAG